MRISTPAHVAAFLVAAALLGAASSARPGSFDVQPTFDGHHTSEGDSGASSQDDTPARSWNSLGDDADEGTRHPGRERMRERMVNAGLLTNEEIDQFLADGQSPELHAITAIHCSATGRKPA